MKSLSQTKVFESRLADRIRAARRIANLSQSGLAKQTGVTAGAVAQWESPTGTRPRVGRIEQLASATGVSCSWLLTGLGDARRKKTLEETVPAAELSAFAHDIQEEELLLRYRVLSADAKASLDELLRVMAHKCRR